MGEGGVRSRSAPMPRAATSDHRAGHLGGRRGLWRRGRLGRPGSAAPARAAAPSCWQMVGSIRLRSPRPAIITLSRPLAERRRSAAMAAAARSPSFGAGAMCRSWSARPTAARCRADRRDLAYDGRPPTPVDGHHQAMPAAPAAAWRGSSRRLGASVRRSPAMSMRDARLAAIEPRSQGATTRAPTGGDATGGQRLHAAGGRPTVRDHHYRRP